MSEASFVVGRPRSALDRAIERGEIKATVQTKGGRVRMVDVKALRAFCLQSKFSKWVTPIGRKDLERAVVKVSLSQDVAYWKEMIVSLAPIDEHLTKGLNRLSRLQEKVVVDPEGAPLLRGAKVPVHQIAALAAGQGVEATLEDYPNLDMDQIQTAIDYAKAYPKTGRPYPGKSLKRMLADAIAAGAFDVDTKDVRLTPDDFR